MPSVAPLKVGPARLCLLKWFAFLQFLLADCGACPVGTCMFIWFVRAPLVFEEWKEYTGRVSTSRNLSTKTVPEDRIKYCPFFLFFSWKTVFLFPSMEISFSFLFLSKFIYFLLFLLFFFYCSFPFKRKFSFLITMFYIITTMFYIKKNIR